jgi:hypothetical protein
MELSYIERVIEAVGGSKASAARLLGGDRTASYSGKSTPNLPAPR